MDQRAETHDAALAVQEAKECTTELTAVIEKMKATAETHNNFGFGSPAALNAFPGLSFNH